MATPFSLRPWPTGDKKPKNLAEFITRVNVERNGFRNVSEDQLRDEIRAQEQAEQDGVEDGALDGESESEEEADADKTKTVLAARDEILRNIEAAHQSALMCLDFVSLLLTKETPSQAALTLSPALRDHAGIGTLGAAKIKESNVTPARVKEDVEIATGWRIMGINKTVDSVLEAAERLEKEIGLETKYWADILAVSENGWAVSSLPQEPYTLGVRYGFSESSADYRNNSIAPLRRNDDGTVRIDQGRIGGRSQRVHVVIEEKGRLVGRSTLPARTPDNAPLQDRVLEARNTIFSQELWHEINREARGLLSLGVVSDGSRVAWSTGRGTRVIITLKDLEDFIEAPEDLSRANVAEAVVLGLHFGLCSAHRQNFARRTQPLLSAVAARPAYNILRPVIARFQHHEACSTLIGFLTKLTATLNRAGVDTASFTDSVTTAASQPTPPGPRRLSKSEALMASLAESTEISAELTITPEARIRVVGRSITAQFIRTLFKVFIPAPAPAPAPSGGVAEAQQGPVNPLAYLYPPLDASHIHSGTYPNVGETIHYLRQATIRVLTERYADVAAGRLARDDIDWEEGTSGPVIQAPPDREVRIHLSGGGNGGVVDADDDDDDAGPVLCLAVDGKDAQSQDWQWGGGGGAGGGGDGGGEGKVKGEGDGEGKGMGEDQECCAERMEEVIVDALSQLPSS